MHIPHVAIPLALTAFTRTLTTLTSVPTQPVTLASQTTLDQFADNHCGQYVTTFFTPGDGACHQIDGTKSNRLTNVQDGCTVTGYTDGSCSNNAFVVGLGSCIINTFSFSVDC